MTEARASLCQQAKHRELLNDAVGLEDLRGRRLCARFGARGRLLQVVAARLQRARARFEVARALALLRHELALRGRLQTSPFWGKFRVYVTWGICGSLVSLS